MPVLYCPRYDDTAVVRTFYLAPDSVDGAEKGRERTFPLDVYETRIQPGWT